MLQGFTYILAGEAYCNGVPVNLSVDDANPQTQVVSNDQLFDMAIANFDTALSMAAATDTKIQNAALVGKARALVDENQYSDAAALLAPVTNDFVYNALFSATTIVNDVYDWMFATPNFGPSDKEGGNGSITCRRAETVWPTGNYFKAGVYGADQNLTPYASSFTHL